MIVKILFFGSSDYCLPVLEAINKNFKLLAVITRPDKPVGRKQILTPSCPKQFAMSHNIKAYTPKTKFELLKLKEEIVQTKPDLAISADYGLIIPREIFTIPSKKALNIHFSKLPQFRGPSPVQYTIATGQKSAWITIFILNEKMDEGDIIWQKEVPLEGDETTPVLYKKLFNITAIELPDIIDKYIKKQLKPVKQDNSIASYTRLFTRKDGFTPPQLLDCAIRGIEPTKKQLKSWLLTKNFQLSTFNFQLSIERAIRALSPWPGVWTKLRLHPGGVRLKTGGVRLKILKAHLEDKKLVLDLVQLEGKKPVSFKQFKEGHPDFSLTD